MESRTFRESDKISEDVFDDLPSVEDSPSYYQIISNSISMKNIKDNTHHHDD
jgi:hypothetical protein